MERDLEHGRWVLEAVRPSVDQQKIPDPPLGQGPALDALHGNDLAGLDYLALPARHVAGPEGVV